MEQSKENIVLNVFVFNNKTNQYKDYQFVTEYFCQSCKQTWKEFKIFKSISTCPHCFNKQENNTNYYFRKCSL